MTPESGPSRDQVILDKIATLEGESAVTAQSLSGKKSDLSVKNQIALGDASIRRNIAYLTISLFALVNIVTLIFIGVLYYFDQRDIVRHLVPANDRVVNSQVVISLLGATTVQLGAIAVIMARGVFNVPIDQSLPILEEG
jgi:hypothetical protein